MVLLKLFDTCGLIVGPLMLAAGIVALVLCIRASQRPGASQLRQAVYASIMPLVIGICGASIGLVLILLSPPPGGIRDDNVAALGKVILAGLTVSAIPMLWCLMLLRPRVAA